VNHFWIDSVDEADFQKSMYVYLGLDNLEYIISRYQLGFVSKHLLRRAVRTFRSRCESASFVELAAKLSSVQSAPVESTATDVACSTFSSGNDPRRSCSMTFAERSRGGSSGVSSLGDVHHITAGVLFLLLATIAPALANSFVLPYEPGRQGRVAKFPLITITVKDKDNQPVDITVLVDTGNTDGPAINPKTADRLGLVAGDATTVKGSGGNVESKKVSFTGDKALSVKDVKTPEGQADKAVTISGPGVIAPGLPDNTITVGQDFLDRFIQTFDPEKRTLTLTALDQRDKKPPVGPESTPIKKEEKKGTMNVIPDSLGPSWAVDIPVRVGANLQVAPFTISTGFDLSLISEDFAALLGIDPTGLPQTIIPTAIGDTPVSLATLNFKLFPDDDFSSATFGIIADANNPDRINVLGGDILNELGLYQIDIDESVLRAGRIVPEPATSTMLLGGLLLAALSGTRRRAARQEAPRRSRSTEPAR
jgi:hypothetical protein